MTVSLLIKDVLIVDPAAAVEKHADVRIIDGRIAQIGDNLNSNSNSPLVYARGCWLVPGLIDMHSHLRDFAQSDSETIRTGTIAAAAGGFSTVVAMANSRPPVDSSLVLREISAKIEASAVVRVLPACCVTRGMKGEELTNMVELAGLGAAAFSDDGRPITNLEVLRRALEYSRLTGKVIISHAEDTNLSAGGLVHKSATALRFGLAAIPGSAESAAVAREIEVAAETGQRLHFAHVSTARSVELIRTAQAAGIKVTGEATPHHIVLSVDDIAGEHAFDASFKMSPPLRLKSDAQAVRQGLIDQTLCAVATDHAPHTRSQKQATFDCAPVGVTGLETALPLIFEVLLHNNKLSPLKIIGLFTSGPAGILNIPVPTLESGCSTFALIDPRHRWTYKTSAGYSKGINSPFDGRQLAGKVVMTMYQGSVVYQDSDHPLHGEINAGRRVKERQSTNQP